MITRIGLEQLLRIFDYLAFESDAEMPAVRLVADLIWKYLPIKPLPQHPGIELVDRLRRGITPVDRSRGYAQFKGVE
jgi:hypothetical protein